MPIIVATVFTHNQSQAVSLPTEARLSDEVKKAIVDNRGHERIISPPINSWDNFFLNKPSASDDFINDRETQKPSNKKVCNTQGIDWIEMLSAGSSYQITVLVE